ncbi:MAG: ATP-binding protein [Gaiella sp.]|nr:ATP-binding protein [Gaiella sp.]
MRRRLLWSYLAVAVLVLGLLAIPLAISYADNEREDLTHKVERDAIALSTLVEDALESGTTVPARVAGVARSYTSDTGGRVLVVDRLGRVVVDSDPTGSRDFSTRPEVARALAGEVASGTRHSSTLGVDLLYVAVPVASGGVVHGAVRISYPTSAVESRIHRYWMLLAIIAAAVLGAAALVATVLSRWMTRPLARLEEAAEAIAAGDLMARASVEGPPEVRRLAETFNAMTAELDQLVRSQDAFVADASHQLRTPLAALRLRLENLDRDVADAGKDELEGALAEVERFSTLVDGLLALARADRARKAPERVAVARVVDERLAAWNALAEERGVTLRHDVDAGAVALATPGRLEQVLDNLFANALDVSCAGTEITVSAIPSDGWVELHVADEGPGMSADERGRAFDRFWRAPGREGQGSGLGLAIVRRLAAADGGSVELREARSGGLDAVVRLPRAAADALARVGGYAPR